MYIYVIVTITSNEQVHDHSHAHCFMRILEGTALETRFFTIIIMITIVMSQVQLAKRVRI